MAFKREVGLYMAREGVPSSCRLGFADGGGTSLLTLELPDGTRRGPFPLAAHFPLHQFEDSRRIQEINRMNRENMKHRVQAHELAPGGPITPSSMPSPHGGQ